MKYREAKQKAGLCCSAVALMISLLRCNFENVRTKTKITQGLELDKLKLFL